MEDYENWIEESLQELRDYVGNQDLEVENEYMNHYYATDGGEEYIVYANYDSAEQDAITRVEEDLEENAEYFNQDWLMGFVDGEDFFRSVFDEWNYAYAEDIENEGSRKYENRLIEEMVDWGIMDEEEAESDEAETIADMRKDDFVSELTDDQISQGGGGYDYYENNFGKEEAMRVVMENNLINIYVASRDAVDTDGVAHFISSYDGNEIELRGSGAYAYRTN